MTCFLFWPYLGKLLENQLFISSVFSNLTLSGRSGLFLEPWSFVPFKLSWWQTFEIQICSCIFSNPLKSKVVQVGRIDCSQEKADCGTIPCQLSALKSKCSFFKKAGLQAENRFWTSSFCRTTLKSSGHYSLLARGRLDFGNLSTLKFW